MTDESIERIVPAEPITDGQELEEVATTLLGRYPDFEHRIIDAMRAYHKKDGGPEEAQAAHAKLARLEDQAIEGV